MITDTESIIRQGRIVMLLELIKARELASSAGQYEAVTALILGLLEQLPNPYAAGAALPPLTLLLQKLVDDIATGEFVHPFKFDTEDGCEVLCVRLGYVMRHLTRSTWMLQMWDTMPLRTSSRLRQQLQAADALLLDVIGNPKEFERTLGGTRVGHLVAIRLSAFTALGVDTAKAKASKYKPQP